MIIVPILIPLYNTILKHKSVKVFFQRLEKSFKWMDIVIFSRVGKSTQTQDPIKSASNCLDILPYQYKYPFIFLLKY